MEKGFRVNTKVDMPEKRYGMVVDLNRCVGCQTCTIACKQANDTPPGVQWRRVLDVEQGTYPDVERLFLVVGCQHCAEPPCVPVCPTGATSQRSDGLVTMDYDTCIGCGYCAVSCPYQARTIGRNEEWYYGKKTEHEEYVSRKEREGVANKCTFCSERLDEARKENKIPGVDLEYTPACSAACIASAIHFGDFNDPQSNVSSLTRDNEFFQMHSDLGTDPQIKYLYEVSSSMPGKEPDSQDIADEALSEPSNPLAGKVQEFWDFRALMNFALGGMSSGLIILATLTYFFVGIPEKMLIYLYVSAGLGIAVGLFFVFMEIGRKSRFLLVLLRPNSSWMTRETYAVAVFYPVLVAAVLWGFQELYLVMSLIALLFLYCQAKILHVTRGVPAWRVDLIPTMIVVAGLTEGMGLFAIVVGLLPQLFLNTIVFVSILGVLLSTLTAVLWQLYLVRAKTNGLSPLARRELERITPLLRYTSHLTPLICFPLAVGFNEIFLLVAGGASVVGGIIWKFTIIIRASYMQGYSLPKIPQRGSGSKAAPARLAGFSPGSGL